MIGFAILLVVSYTLLLATMYAVPGLLLTTVAALVFALFGIPVEFGWPLFGASVAVIAALRAFVGQPILPVIKIDTKPAPRPPVVVEDLAVRWSYHLSGQPFDGKAGKVALCGRKSQMPTRIPLEAWGTVTHLREKWCPVCAAKAGILPRTNWRDAGGDGRNMSPDEHIAEGIHELAKKL